jgi:hypothetical protein
MKIQGSNPVRTPQPRRAGKSEGAGGARFSVEEQDAPKLRNAGQAERLDALESLLLAQEAAGEAPDERKWARDRGDLLLDQLDRIRVGLLNGLIPAETIPRLLTSLDRRRREIVDPGLRETLDEIELRARVELAKLERSGLGGAQ